MRNKLGTICMILGAALVLGAFSLFLWNRREAGMAEASVETILPQVISKIEEVSAHRRGGDASYPDPYAGEMTKAEIDGYEYIGYISVPALSLELPVMSDLSYEQLKLSPCRYCGSVRTDDLVIAAHNYARHFGNIKNLAVGDEVYFTDMDGVVFEYEVAELEILAPTDVEEMTDGGYGLTLFTCTYGGQSRVTVRCERMEKK